MQIELRRGLGNAERENGRPIGIWLPDQPSPFGDDPTLLPYSAIALYEDGEALNTEDAYRYQAELVTAKDGPAGSIQLLSLIERPDHATRAEALQHWQEHIPLAVEIHHKALRYRQYRFAKRLTREGPDYIGLAVLDFATPDDLRSGIYRDAADEVLIAEDIADFVGRADTMFGTEYLKAALPLDCNHPERVRDA